MLLNRSSANNIATVIVMFFLIWLLAGYQKEVNQLEQQVKIKSKKQEELNQKIENQNEKIDQQKEYIEKNKRELKKLRQKVSKKPPEKNTKRVALKKGVSAYRYLCEKNFPSEVSNCLTVMSGESGGNPYAKSHTSDYGLFQINCPVWCGFFKVTPKQLYDPETNAKLARVIYDRAGKSWKPWVYARKVGIQ